MTKPTIPAPERDLGQTDPQIPPASTEASPLSRMIFGSFAVAMGIVVVVVAVMAGVFQASPLPQDLFNGDEITAAVLAGCGGLCLVGCGMAIFRRSTLLACVLLVLFLLCGFAASVVS